MQVEYLFSLNIFHTTTYQVVKRNPLFLHEIEWKNNGFLFTTPNIIINIIKYDMTVLMESA